MNAKDKAIENLKAWFEDAILCAELEIAPSIESLEEIRSQAKAAGMSLDEIEELVWTPYSN